MDLKSAKAKEVLRLNKKDVTKRLQIAVRSTQGGKRACWAPSERPSWWKEGYQVTMLDGEVVKSLPFVSQSKLYWALESAKATLLLYEFRDAIAQSEKENDNSLVHENAGTADTSPSVQRIIQQQTPQLQSPKPVATEPEDVLIVAEESPEEVQTISEPQLEQEDSRERSVEANDEREASQDDRDGETRKEEVLKQIAELKAKTHKELAVWEEKQAWRRKLLQQSILNDIQSIQVEFGMSKMRNWPANIADMYTGEYVKEYGANALPFLNKETAQAVEAMMEDLASLTADDHNNNPLPNTYSEMRRNELTATARKTSRAVRRRQMEEGMTPGLGLARSRPQRPSAMKALDRNRAILQGNAVRNQKPPDSAARSRKRPLPDNMITPAPRLQATQVDNPSRQECLETARKHKGDKRAFCQEQARICREQARQRKDEVQKQLQEMDRLEETANVWEAVIDAEELDG